MNYRILNMKNKILYIALTTIMLLSSCSMKQEIRLGKSGEGQMSFQITLAPYLGDVIEQVQMLMNSEEKIPAQNDSFFDIPAIRDDFKKNKNAELLNIESPDRLSLMGAIRFDSIDSMLQQVEQFNPENRMISFKSLSDHSELSVLINRSTVEGLLKANPSLNSPLVQNFGPSTTEGMSRTDYLDMMGFALGEESRLGISNSKLSLTVHVDGGILTQKGGKKINDKTVIYEIPLLDVLILDKPLNYSLSYR